MKKSVCLLCSSLLFLIGTSTVFAHGPFRQFAAIIIRGESNVIAGNAIKSMLPRIVTKEAGVAFVASGIATSNVIKNAIQINSFSLPATLSTRMEASSIAVKANVLTVEQMTKLLVKSTPKTFAGLSDLEKEMLFLKGYPAATVEWPIVLSPAQQTQAVDFYRELLRKSITEDPGIDTWARKMAAITSLGFISPNVADAEIILQAVKAQRSTSIFRGTTDVVAVRAFLNLKAYDYVQKLADFRLLDSKKLSAEWKEIKRYMRKAGLELDIPQNKIIPFSAQPTVANSPSTIQWLRYYNDYNIFHVDPSAETTADFLNLRKAIDENRAAFSAQQQVIGQLKPKGPTTI